MFRERIEHYHGRIVDMAGDSILVIFDSATGAVNAADAQLDFISLLAHNPETREMWTWRSLVSRACQIEFHAWVFEFTGEVTCVISSARIIACASA